MIKFAIRSMGVALILGSMLASASLAAAQEAPPPTAPPMATKMPGPEPGPRSAASDNLRQRSVVSKKRSRPRKQ